MWCLIFFKTFAVFVKLGTGSAGPGAQSGAKESVGGKPPGGLVGWVFVPTFVLYVLKFEKIVGVYGYVWV